MITKLNTIKILNYFFFLSTFALLFYTDAVYVSQEISSGLMINLKYVTLLLGIAFSILQIGYRERYKNSKTKNLIYVYEVKKISLVLVVFLFISLCFSLFSGKFNIITIGELIKLLLPIIYAFCVLNTFSFKDIYNCMVAVLFFSIGGYILEVGINTFTLENIKKISFSSSYSPFESHYAAGASIAMCTFFMYYREKPLYKYISLLFALLTFKRLSVLFAIFLLVMPWFVDVNKKISKRCNFSIKVFFLVATYLYYLILQPGLSEWFEKIFHSDANDFTMGRSLYIEKMINSGFSSYGFGSTTIFLGKNMEMDLIKISVELSIVGLCFFIYHYWDIARKHLYCIIYMFYLFTNLLTSHSLTNAFGWILTYVIIGCILYKQNNDLSYLKYKKKNKIFKIKL